MWFHANEKLTPRQESNVNAMHTGFSSRVKKNAILKDFFSFKIAH